jgi:SOS response regulatory protein OraA/RecX
VLPTSRRRSAPAPDPDAARRRAIQRLEAVDEALRLLERRDLPRAALEERLVRRGVPDRERSDALAALVQTGLVDDERYARVRAARLAEQGWGDEGIRFRLEQAGLPAGAAKAAVEALEPELERARALTERRGASVATASFLARRGFGEEAVEAALPPDVAL